MKRRTDILDRKNEILSWVSENLPNAEIARRLKCKVQTLKSYYEFMGITYSGNKGRRGLQGSKKKSVLVSLSEGKSITNSKIRRALIEENIKKPVCECCGLETWMGKPIPLELHHKDFDHYNNDLSNLQILCSNCHMQAHNYNNTYKPC